MKILFISDIHGININLKKIEKVIEKEKIDYSSKISEYPIHSSASGICSLIAKMLNDESGNVEHWQEFIEKNFLDIINTIVAPEIKFSRIFTKTNEENTHELYLEEENKGGIKLSDCGSGLKTIIATLALLHIIPHLTQSYKNVFAFEELENNMHPSLERKLLYHIRLYSERYPESLIFLTTHSNVAIDLFGKDYRAQIVRVSNDGYKSIVESVISDRDKQMLLDDLGVKASDILQSNCLIWVEGPSDRIYVKKWIDLFSNRKFEEGLHYQFILYGGSLLSHYSVDKKDFISLFMKNVQFVESYDDIEDDILKFSIASFDDQMEQRIEKIQKQLKPHLKLVTTGNVWFDIFYKDVNKGTTLTHLLEILKIKPEESGAFGDQMNDYEMLQTVKYGYAMANAMPPVKEVAYQVIDSNENDGVILKIKEILKGNY